MYQQIDYNFHHWAWYMGHTSMSQFHTVLSRFLTAVGYCRKWCCINKLIIIFIIELGIWVIRACPNFIRVTTILWSVYDGLLWYMCNRLLLYMGHTSKWQIHTGDDHFLTAAGYYRKWWCINKSIIIFIIELGIWVILACPNFIRVWDVFWRWLVTAENDDVSTNLF